MRKVNLRPAGFDDLGLRRALSDRLMPGLVAAMAFLAALALAGAIAASSLADRWREGAAAAITVQVPNPSDRSDRMDGGSRIDRAATLLRGTPGVRAAEVLPTERLHALLRPWLGSEGNTMALPLPAVIEVRLAAPEPDLDALGKRLTSEVPGTILESQGVWMQRLTLLARSLQACAGLAVLVVALVATAVIAVATRAGLAARRDAIEIVHGLGATDGYIAARFARRTTRLATTGAALGTVAALPVLVALAAIVAPFAAGAPTASGFALGLDLPRTLWVALPCLPVAAAVIGWTTAQGTVRAWLRRLA